MKITFLQIDKTDDESIKKIIDKYSARLKHYISFEIITIPDIKNSKNLSPEQFKEKEAEAISKYFNGNRFIVLLDENGKHISSKEFAGFIQQKLNQSVKELCFLIGGAYGVAESIKKSVNYTMSLSKMTFPHQLIRIIFIEQLYRAMTILKNEPYHNE
jgi:23S rRNA (pseudouridine1915-N3)-methyltransferase